MSCLCIMIASKRGIVVFVSSTSITTLTVSKIVCFALGHIKATYVKTAII